MLYLSKTYKTKNIYGPYIQMEWWKKKRYKIY